MQVGTKVYVLRGKNNSPMHQRHYAFAEYCGTSRGLAIVRLTMDDKFASYPPFNKGEFGCFGFKSLVKA